MSTKLMGTADLQFSAEHRIVPDAVIRELYRKMLGVFYIEERLKILTRQGKISFLASTRGHEKVQVGTVMLMKPGHDWFFPYYREKAVAYALGMPMKDIFLHMLSREAIPVQTAATCRSTSHPANCISSPRLRAPARNTCRPSAWPRG